MRRVGPLQALAAGLVIVVGAVHLQQYADFIKDVPTIGPLFALNSAAAGVIVGLLAFGRLRALAALGGVALCAGSLVAIALAMTGGLFDYTEPTLRAPIVIAIAAELTAVVALVALVPAARRAAT